MKNKKMTRLEYYAKGKGTLANKTEFREGRIKRTLEGFIAEAKEKATEADINAESVLDKITNSAENTNSLISVFNDYVGYKGDAEDYRRTAKLAQELADKLNEEVEVEFDEKD